MTINSKPFHGQAVVSDGQLTRQAQAFFDDIEMMLNTHLLGQSVVLPSYTISSLPDASVNINGVIMVSDEVGGAVTAFSDGANWRRTTDRAVVS